MTDQNGERSLPRSRKGFTVAASPFNAVKFDLAIILVLSVVVFFLHARVTESPVAQIMFLLGFGLMSMCWLLVRTKKVLRENSSNGSLTKTTDS